MRSTEIVFTSGVSVTGGASLHAYLGYTGYCTDDMAGRTEITENGVQNNSNNNNLNELKLVGKNKDETLLFSVTIYPNPKSFEQNFIIELKSTSGALCEVFDLTGRLVHQERITEGKNTIKIEGNSSSKLIIKTTSNENKIVYNKLATY